MKDMIPQLAFQQTVQIPKTVTSRIVSKDQLLQDGRLFVASLKKSSMHWLIDWLLEARGSVKIYYT